MIVLLNRAQVLAFDAIFTAVQTLCVLPTPSTPSDIFPDPQDLPDFEGTYFDPRYYGEITVSQDGSQLRISIPAMASTQYDDVLVPGLRNLFFLIVSAPVQMAYELTLCEMATGTCSTSATGSSWPRGYRQAVRHHPDSCPRGRHANSPMRCTTNGSCPGCFMLFPVLSAFDSAGNCASQIPHLS